MTVSRSRASISRPMSPVSSTPPICRLRRAAGSSSEVRMDFSPTCGGVPAKPGRGSVLQTWGPYGFLPRLWGSSGEAGEGVGCPDVGRRRYLRSPSFAGGLIRSLEQARVGPRQVGHVVGVVIPAQQELAHVLRQWLPSDMGGEQVGGAAG